MSTAVFRYLVQYQLTVSYPDHLLPLTIDLVGHLNPESWNPNPARSPQPIDPSIILHHPSLHHGITLGGTFNTQSIASISHPTEYILSTLLPHTFLHEASTLLISIPLLSLRTSTIQASHFRCQLQQVCHCNVVLQSHSALDHSKSGRRLICLRSGTHPFGSIRPIAFQCRADRGICSCDCLSTALRSGVDSALGLAQMPECSTLVLARTRRRKAKNSVVTHNCLSVAKLLS